MRDILISTVGTSLKGNILHGEEILRNLYEKENAKGVAVELCKLSSDDRICGAEINSINSIIDKGYLASNEHLKLFVSDTPEGRFIGEILSHYFKRAGRNTSFVNVQLSVVEGLTDLEPHRFKNEGLRNLVRLISETVRQYGSKRILINATGGYKAQISFAGMIGQALEIPVCYLFERFSEVIILPPQPVSFDLDFWLKNADLFFELEHGIITTARLELDDERFATLIEELEEDREHMTSLSPTGQLFHESFRYHFSRQKATLLPRPSDLSDERRLIKFEDKNRGKHRGLDAYLKKILESPYVNRIYTHYYNPSLSRSNIFKHSSKGVPGQVEGWFGNGGGLTKFDVVTTSLTEEELQACIADLNNRFLD